MRTAAEGDRLLRIFCARCGVTVLVLEALRPAWRCWCRSRGRVMGTVVLGADGALRGAA